MRGGGWGVAQPKLFLAIFLIIKMYGTLTISHLNYISISFKAVMVSCDKRSRRTSRPLGLLFFFG